MSAWAATTAAGKGIPGCALSVSTTLDFRMEWNAEGQLKRVLLNGNEVARFTYDPSGRRVEKVAGGVTTSYLYDGEDILREIRGAATFKYVHGPGIDEPFAREESAGALAYYHADGLGSIVKRTSQAGAVVHEYRYDAWGNIEAGASESGYAFTGREWDPEIGLHYYRARHYDANLGRFMSEDPLSSRRGLGRYAYVENHPTRFIDPFGHKESDFQFLLRVDKVAVAAMESIFPKCQKLTKPRDEYQGTLCKCGDQVVAEEPVLGQSGDTYPPCKNGDDIGFYHCHTKYSEWPEMFSTDDNVTITFPPTKIGYLVTPSGRMLRKTGSGDETLVGVIKTW